MTSTSGSGRTQCHSPPALKNMVLHVLRQTRVLLRPRKADLQDEVRRWQQASATRQAELLELAIRGLVRGVDLLHRGKCQNKELREILRAMTALHRQMSERIEQEVRGAGLNGDWPERGLDIVATASRRIRELEQKARRLPRGCGDCTRC